ncbi:MAG: hypothetical protein QXT73_00575 [Candidatus Methanomethylicaceae archaeon]
MPTSFEVPVVIRVRVVGEDVPKKIKESTDVFGRFAENLKNTFAVFALGYTSVSIFLSTIRGVQSAFSDSIRVARDFEDTLTSLTALIMSFTKRSPGESMAESLKHARDYAQSLIDLARELDPLFIGTQRQLIEVMETMLKNRVMIRAEDENHKKAVLALATAYKLLVPQSEREGQVAQEISGFLEGRVNATTKLAQYVASLNEEYKKEIQYATTSEEKMALILKYFESMLSVQPQITSNWSTLTSSFKTLYENILLAGMKPFFEWLKGIIASINTYLGGTSQEAGKFNTVASTIRTNIERIIAILDAMLTGIAAPFKLLESLGIPIVKQISVIFEALAGLVLIRVGKSILSHMILPFTTAISQAKSAAQATTAIGSAAVAVSTKMIVLETAFLRLRNLAMSIGKALLVGLGIELIGKLIDNAALQGKVQDVMEYIEKEMGGVATRVSNSLQDALDDINISRAIMPSSDVIEEIAVAGVTVTREQLRDLLKWAQENFPLEIARMGETWARTFAEAFIQGQIIATESGFKILDQEFMRRIVSRETIEGILPEEVKKSILKSHQELSKAIADQAAARAEMEKAQVDKLMAELENAYKRGEVSVKEYYDRKEQLVLRAYDAEISKISAMEQAEREQYQKRRELIELESRHKEEAAAQLKAAEEEYNAKVLSLTAQRAQALVNLQKELMTIETERQTKLIELTKLRLDYFKDASLEELNIERERIDLLRDLSAISPVEAAERSVALKRAELEVDLQLLESSRSLMLTAEDRARLEYSILLTKAKIQNLDVTQGLQIAKARIDQYRQEGELLSTTYNYRKETYSLLAEEARFQGDVFKYQNSLIEAIRNEKLERLASLDALIREKEELLAIAEASGAIDEAALQRMRSMIDAIKEMRSVTAQVYDLRIREAQQSEDFFAGFSKGLQQIGMETTPFKMGMELAEQAVNSLSNAISALIQDSATGFQNWRKIVLDVLKDIASAIFKTLIQIWIVRPLVQALAGATAGPTSWVATSGLMYRSGGIIPGEFRPVSSFQYGGVVHHPTLGLIGEGGPEAVVPLSRGRYIPVELKKTPSINTSINVNVNYVGGPGETQASSQDLKRMGKVISEMIKAEFNKNLREHMRPGGMLWMEQFSRA